MTSKKPQENLPNPEVLDWASRQDDVRYVRHYARSVELIQESHKRGMSRAAMARIWPERLLNLVLGHEAAK